MTSTVLDRVPVDEISAAARNVHVGRALLAFLALIPFMIGWTAGKIVLSVAWLGLAVKAGWIESRTPATRDGG